MHIKMVLLGMFACLSSCCFGWFGGVEPIGPQDNLRRNFAPYDLVEMNYLATNYCENLFDKRVNFISYTHLNYDIPSWDGWHLHFPDDNGRFLEGLVCEDQYSPMVRLEFARRLTKGLMSARYPGTRAFYSFRHRNDGKTFLIFADDETPKLCLSTWGDFVAGYLNIGFVYKKNDILTDVNAFSYYDEPKDAGSGKVVRINTDENGIVESGQGISRYWNESPFSFKRYFKNDNKKVDFTGKYWFSNEDKPLEFAFESKDADELAITVGDHKVCFGSSWTNAETFIQLPDRKTSFSSIKDGDKVFESPEFKYFIIRKDVNWSGVGYSVAMLVIFEEQPDRIEAYAKQGYNDIRLIYNKKKGIASGRIWLYPFDLINRYDMDYVFSNGESFLATGKMMFNGFPSQQLWENIPAGLAAGAYLLTKYNDPTANTARIQAEAAVDALVLAELDGMQLGHRIFAEIRAAAWMVKLGKLTGDQRLVDKYTPWIDKIMQRMLTAESGYDGKGWTNGWRHFCAMRAVWIAYEATDRQDYLDVYSRALSVYTIDEKGLYRNGIISEAPGCMDETYFGSLALGAFGHAGMLKEAQQLLDLDVPAGGRGGADPNIHLKNLWNDAGAGPWACDDSNPNFIGYCLRGLNMLQKTKTILPLGAFPVYDVNGNITITSEPMLDNPYFPQGCDKIMILSDISKYNRYLTEQIKIKPGDINEIKYLVQDSGILVDGQRNFKIDDKPLIYKFDVSDAKGAAIDVNMFGNSYVIDVSPDGKRWYQRLNSWSSESVNDSIDVSFLVGNPDEMLQMAVIAPPDDSSLICSQKGTKVLRNHCRYVRDNGYFVYRLNLDKVKMCSLEFVVGNGYKVEISSDGTIWNEEINERFIKIRENINKTADGAWLRIVDITKYLNDSGYVYMRFSDNGNISSYDGQGAFLRRLTIYGVIESNDIYVRLSNCPFGPKKGFMLNELTFRKWFYKDFN